jgi:hypothetical protein
VRNSEAAGHRASDVDRHVYNLPQAVDNHLEEEVVVWITLPATEVRPVDSAVPLWMTGA